MRELVGGVAIFNLDSKATQLTEALGAAKICALTDHGILTRRFDVHGVFGDSQAPCARVWQAQLRWLR